MFKRFGGLFFVPVLLFLMALPAAAGGRDEERHLPEVVVTASAEPSEVHKLPATVQVISASQIERSGATTLDEVLDRYMPGNGLVQPGGFASVGMRGFRSYESASSSLGDRVLLLIDGHRTGTGNAAAIPLVNVERVEIVRGPSSVLYGGSAMGGVVNLITKRGKGKAKGSVGAGYGTSDTRFVDADVSGGIGEGDWGYSLGVRGEARSAYKDGNGNRYRNTGLHNGAAGGTLSFYPDEETSLSLVGSHKSIFDTGSPGGYYAYGLTPHDKVRNAYNYLALEYESKCDNGVSLQGSLYANRNRYDYAWSGFYGNGNTTYRADVLGGRGVVGLPLGGLGRFSLGIDYSHLRERTYGSSISQPNAVYDVLGVFAEHRLDAGEVAMSWGLRYDLYKERLRQTSGLDAVHADDKTFQHLSWSVGATWWMLDWLGLRAVAASAFVPPTAKTLAGDYWTGGVWGTHYVGNRDLDPEKSVSGEVGLELDYNTLRGSLSYFYTRYTDRIVTHALQNGSVTWRNEGEQRLAGFSIALNYSDSFDINRSNPLELSLYGNGEIYTERHSRNGKIPTALYVPSWSAVGGVGLGYGMFWLDVNGRFTGSQYQDNFTTYGITRMGSFATWNTRLTIKPIKDLSVYLDVTNLTNKQYAYTLDYPMPGRTVSVGFKYSY